jgi:glycosyltransferase involved in cell wall biosynthesis
MKIVHILPALTKGGGERVAVDLANHFAQAGHQVTVVVGVPVDPALLQDDLRPEISLRFIAGPAASKVSRYLAIPFWLWRNWRWLVGQDIVHCHLTLGATVGSLIQLARLLTGRRTPAVVETYHAVGMPIPPFNRWLQSILVARRDGLVLMAEDDFWRAFIAARPKLNAAIIPNGVAIPAPVSDADQRAYRRALGIPDTCRVVGTVGRLAPERRPTLYVPVMARIAEAAGPDVHFIIGGEGPELEAVRALVAEHGLEGRIHLPGIVRRPAVAMAVMDLYLTLNVGPVTGMAGLEAAGAGTPVLAIQLIDDYRADSSDIFWSSTDLAEVGDRAIALMGSDVSRRALAQKQHEYVRDERSVEVMAQRYQRRYRAALERVRDRSVVQTAATTEDI